MLESSDHIHLIGIGGTGLSAIARVLHERGYSVSGSDQHASPLTDALLALGIEVQIGHHAENILGATIVVRSSAIPETNVEVRAANLQNIPVLKRSDFLGALMTGKTGVAIAGTHGKTTTTSLAAWLLSDQDLDPSFIIGGVVDGLGTNARAGKGPHFVIEADEYDHMFLGLRPDIAVITNVEHDHPDLFTTAEEFTRAFEQFVDLIPQNGTLLIWGDSPETLALSKRAAENQVKIITYGRGAGNDLQAINPVAVPGTGYQFSVNKRGRILGEIKLQIPGVHNMLNGLAAVGIGLQVGLGFGAIADSLSRFSGVGRRFDVRGEVGGVIVVDDYAHHPTEIKATISAARGRYPGKELWVTWQPHTFSRVALLCDEFAQSFRDADHVIVTDVYAARETAPEDFTLAGLIAAMSHPDVNHIQTLDETASFLTKNLRPGSVLLVLSAGNADQISEQVIKNLPRRSPQVGA